MSIWKSDEKQRSFVSLISPSKIILFEKKYQAFDAVFITRWNTSKIVGNTPLRVIFSTFFLVLHLVMKHCVLCLILLVTSNTHSFFESTEMKIQHCHLLFHFFSSLFFCLCWPFLSVFFFSLTFTFKGHNFVMKSISPKRRSKLKTKSSNGIPSTSLNMLIKCTLNEFFVRPSVQSGQQRHPSAVAVSHE